MKLFLLLYLYIISSTCIPSLPGEPVKHAGRVIGGEIAKTDQFPFAAAIHVTTSDSIFFCGGTLINNQWIVSAGQCVYNAILFNIQLGSVSLLTDNPNRLTLATSTSVVHPDYNPQTLENDIGLIKLRIAIEFTDYIQPIYTLPGDHVQVDYVLLAVGWGQLSDSDPELANDLNWARVTTLTNMECKITYGSQITDNMLCAEGNYNEGPCTGDTGGPLVELIKYGNGLFAGVASFISGNGCESTDPSGYTRVYPYIDWMRNITSEA